jgi:hypothetical protein
LDPVERVWAISYALNGELGDLADAGCPVVRLEELPKPNAWRPTSAFRWLVIGSRQVRTNGARPVGQCHIQNYLLTISYVVYIIASSQGQALDSRFRGATRADAT